MPGPNQIVPLGSPPPSSDDFQIYTVKPSVRFLSRGVQPPSPVYVTVNDDLVAGVASSQVNETVTFSYRLLRFDGEIIMGQFQIRPASDRSVTTHLENLAEGFLLSVSCKANVAVSRGQTFARVFITDPVLGGGQPSYMLMADYVTTAMAPAHPNGRVLAPSEGPGNRRAVLSAVPGIGAQWIVTVPANARWKVRSFDATLTTDAVAGNRYVIFETVIAGLVACEHGADKVQPASQVTNYSGAAITPNLSPVATQGMVGIPPELLMLGGDQVNSLVQGMDAGDQWTAVAVHVEEWLDNV